MELSVKIEGLDNFKKMTSGMQSLVIKEMAGALKASGEKVRGEAIQSILGGGKTGKLYKRGGKFHTASAAGEAPANDSGRLAGSIHTVKSGNEALIIAGRGQVKYARMLEYGTKNMAERPFMYPALEKSKAWIIKRLNDAVVRAARKSIGK